MRKMTIMTYQKPTYHYMIIIIFQYTIAENVPFIVQSNKNNNKTNFDTLPT